MKEIVIKLDDKTYQDIKDNPRFISAWRFEEIWSAIANGIVLSENHGCLEDTTEK